MKLLLKVCYRLSLFSFLLIVLIFFLFIAGNNQEFLDSTQVMLMHMISGLSLFSLIITSNLIVASLWAFYLRNRKTLPYFIYGVLSFVVILGIRILIKTIEIWI